MAEIKFFGGEIMANVEDDDGGQNMKEKDLPTKVWVENNGDSVWWEDPNSKKYTEYYRKDVLEQEKKKLIKKACKFIKESVDDYLQYPFSQIDAGELVKNLKKILEGK